LRETVSLAYQIVLAVGFIMEIAAGCQLARFASGKSLPVTAGIQGRRAMRVLKSIVGSVESR